MCGAAAAQAAVLHPVRLRSLEYSAVHLTPLVRTQPLVWVACMNWAVEPEVASHDPTGSYVSSMRYAVDH
jgi:hypothetical protein